MVLGERSISHVSVQSIHTYARKLYCRAMIAVADFLGHQKFAQTFVDTPGKVTLPLYNTVQTTLPEVRSLLVDFSSDFILPAFVNTSDVCDCASMSACVNDASHSHPLSCSAAG